MLNFGGVIHDCSSKTIVFILSMSVNENGYIFYQHYRDNQW